MPVFIAYPVLNGRVEHFGYDTFGPIICELILDRTLSETKTGGKAQFIMPLRIA